MTFPDAACFAWVFQRRAKVGSALLAERFLHYVELLAVAAGDVDLDLDRAVDVANRSTNSTCEARTALKWREALKSHGHSASERLDIDFQCDFIVEGLPLAFPVVCTHLEDL